eukprot:c38198_g1_i1 orf=37-264(-)
MTEGIKGMCTYKENAPPAIKISPRIEGGGCTIVSEQQAKAPLVLPVASTVTNPCFQLPLQQLEYMGMYALRLESH